MICIFDPWKCQKNVRHLCVALNDNQKCRNQDVFLFGRVVQSKFGDYAIWGIFRTTKIKKTKEAKSCKKTCLKAISWAASSGSLCSPIPIIFFFELMIWFVIFLLLRWQSLHLSYSCHPWYPYSAYKTLNKLTFTKSFQLVPPPGDCSVTPWQEGDSTGVWSIQALAGEHIVNLPS